MKKFSIFACIVVFALAAIAWGTASTANAALVYHYAMNETSGTTAVESVSGANGTYTGSPTLGVESASPSRYGTAMSLAADADGIEIPANTVGAVGLPITVDAWIKPATWNSWQSLCGVDADAPAVSGKGWALEFGKYGEFQLYTGQTGGGYCNATSYGQLGPGNVNQWHNVAFTIDTDGTVGFFFDGAAVTALGSPLTNPSIIDTTDAYRIGALLGAGSDPGMVGGWDECRVYNTVLSESEIGQLAATSPIPEPSVLTLMVTGLAGLLAYAWRKRR